MNQRPKLFVLDAYSLIYQVFHAIPEMTGPDGSPTNAVFGVFRDLLTVINDRKPDFLAVAFDGPGPVFRSDILPDYKAQRKPMPDELIAQIPVIRRVYEGFHVPILEFEGYEADDVIATLARRGAERGLDVFIATSDKDARQLLSDRIHIYNLRKKEILDVEGLKKDWGVAPEQVVDLLALTGDAVDNVPGIPGIGLKTATALLQEFGDLESLLASASKVSGKKRQENLRDHAETARRAKRLIELHDNLPLELDWNALKLKPADVRELKTLCRDSRAFHRREDSDKRSFELGVEVPEPFFDDCRFEDRLEPPRRVGVLNRVIRRLPDINHIHANLLLTLADKFANWNHFMIKQAL